jgi:hypothetical protein
MAKNFEGIVETLKKKIGPIHEAIVEPLKAFTSLSFDNEEQKRASKKFLIRVKNDASLIQQSRILLNTFYNFNEYVFEWFSTPLFGLELTFQFKQILRELFVLWEKGVAATVDFLKKSADQLVRLIELESVHTILIFKQFIKGIETPLYKLNEALTEFSNLV